MNSNKDGEKLAREIKKIRNVIRKKHKVLQKQTTQQRTALHDQLRPLVDPLKSIEAQIKKEPIELSPVKTEPLEEQSFTLPTITEENVDYDDEEDILPAEKSFSEKRADSVTEYVNSNFSGAIAKQWFHLLLSDSPTLKLTDSTYGIYAIGDKYMMGESEITVKDNDIIAGNKKFKGTNGLYHLIFSRNPREGEYTSSDLKSYKELLQKTKSYLNIRTGRVKATGSLKYKNIIKPLIESFGSGMKLNNKKLDYVYYDDINELCNRLRLLWTSREAGNNSHTNEIISIIEELSEAGVIKSGFNEFINTL